MISSYFVTGTGRCGTLLLSKILSCSADTHCNHEYAVDTIRMKKALRKDNLGIVIRDIDRLLHPTIMQYNNAQKSYGECSGHLYPLFPELYRRYENTTRFILLIRNPVDFVRSALARGFFNPDHPYPLEHVAPPKSTEMGRKWHDVTPLEKCAWYWAFVNGIVCRFFISIPHTLYRILPIESLNINVIEEVYNFLRLKDFNAVKAAVQQLLSVRHNASPGQDTESSVNPYSEEITLGPFSTWSREQVDALHKHVLPIQEMVYGGEYLPSRNIKNLSILK